MAKNCKKKKLLSVLAKILLVITLVSVASAIFIKKPAGKKEIRASEFVIGKISEEGEFSKSNDFLCTKNFIGVEELKITPKDKAKTKFQVFFYDINYKHIYNTDVLSEEYQYIETVPFIEYCKIMIMPSLKVNAFNKFSFINDFSITVKQSQKYSYNDYFEEDLTLKNHSLQANWSEMAVAFIENEGFGVSKAVNVSNVETIYFITNKVIGSENYPWLGLFTTSSGYLKGTVLKSNKEYTELGNFYVYKISCSSQDIVYFNYYLDSDCHLYFERN